MSFKELSESLDRIEKSTAESRSIMNLRLDKFEKKQDERLNELQERIEHVEAKGDRPKKTGSDLPALGEKYVNVKTGETVPVLAHKDRYSDLQPNKSGMSFGRWMRGILTGKFADDRKELTEEMKALATSPDASGGYTVPEPLSREFIDLLRNNLVLSRAGARFVPMTSKTLSLAKLTGDATVEWHAENANVNSSDPTLGIATLSAKTIVGLVKFSVELSEDSINIQEMISRSLSQGTALAIDRAGLGNVITNGPSGIMSFSGRNRITGIGTIDDYDPWIDGMGALLTANVPLERIGASVMGPGTWKALAKLKTGLANDKTPLRKPDALANTPFLVTNSVASSSGSPTTEVAYLADWNDLLYGVRTDINVRVLNEVFRGSNLQVAMLVYARVDFAATREQSFVTLEDFS